ncbi:hypothetical protein THAOC_15802, partial [Thalassiosira oceanica]
MLGSCLTGRVGQTLFYLALGSPDSPPGSPGLVYRFPDLTAHKLGRKPDDQPGTHPFQGLGDPYPRPQAGLALAKTLQTLAANHGQTYRTTAAVERYSVVEWKIFNERADARSGQMPPPSMPSRTPIAGVAVSQTDSGRGVKRTTWEASVEMSISSSVSANKIVEQSLKTKEAAMPAVAADGAAISRIFCSYD